MAPGDGSSPAGPNSPRGNISREDLERGTKGDFPDTASDTSSVWDSGHWAGVPSAMHPTTPDRYRTQQEDEAGENTTEGVNKPKDKGKSKTVDDRQSKSSGKKKAVRFDQNIIEYEDIRNDEEIARRLQREETAQHACASASASAHNHQTLSPVRRDIHNEDAQEEALGDEELAIKLHIEELDRCGAADHHQRVKKETFDDEVLAMKLHFEELSLQKRNSQKPPESSYIEHADNLARMTPGKTLTDEQLATKLHEEECHYYLNTAKQDHRKGLSLARAVETDAELIERLLAEEEAAADHRFARELADGSSDAYK